MSDVTTQRERARPEMSGPVLGMVVFVASEAMFFAAFFGGYFTIRANAPVWPPPDVPHLKIDIASILTVILVTSSLVIQLSLRSIRRGDQRKAVVFLGVTIALGITFLLLQLYDYSQLGFGVKDGTFGTLFNSQVFIGPDGSFLGKHQKLMPTVGERLVHMGGYGDTFGAIQTDFFP